MSTPEPMSYEELVAVRVGLHQPDFEHLAQQVQAAQYDYEDFYTTLHPFAFLDQLARLRALERAYESAVLRLWVACVAVREGEGDG